MTRVVKLLIIASSIVGLFAENANGKQFIDENKVWVYKSTDWRGHHLLSYMKFDGTKEHKGKEYHRFHTFKTQSGICDVINPEFNNNPNEREFFLREEAGKVWLLAEDSNSTEYEDILLYDFSLKDGDSITLHPVADSSIEETYTVVTSTPITIDGNECRVIWYKELEMMDELNIYMIEDVGPSTHGTLAYYTLLYTSSENSGDSDDRLTTRPDACLLKICDIQGNIIFDNEKTGPNASINTISNSTIYISYEGHLLKMSGNETFRLAVYALDGTMPINTADGSEIIIDTSTFTPGVYVAVAESDDATVARRKFVVK